MGTVIMDQEERNLWNRYKENDDRHARDKLILMYTPTVKFIANRMNARLPAHIEEDDLVSYGLIGLMNAMERFDLSREIKFKTYALPRIKGSMLDELRSMDWIPRSVRSWAKKIERASVKLENNLERTPTNFEIASELDITEEELENILEQVNDAPIITLNHCSQFQTLGDGQSNLELINIIQDTNSPDPYNEYNIQILLKKLEKILGFLLEKERIVICLYYYEGFTIKEIGEVLGVTASRASQLHTKAKEKMIEQAINTQILENK